MMFNTDKSSSTVLVLFTRVKQQKWLNTQETNIAYTYCADDIQNDLSLNSLRQFYPFLPPVSSTNKIHHIVSV